MRTKDLIRNDEELWGHPLFIAEFVGMGTGGCSVAESGESELQRRLPNDAQDLGSAGRTSVTYGTVTGDGGIAESGGRGL